MMRLLRWAGVTLGLVMVGLVLTGVLARFSDGPIGIFPGGPLEAGELHAGTVSTWDFARDIPLMEFQLLEPPRSRTTWVLVHEGRLFLPSGYMDSALGKLWKHWPHDAERDGRSIIRIGGKRYERLAIRVHDDTTFDALAAEIQRKYGASITADAMRSGGAWIFELVDRK